MEIIHILVINFKKIIMKEIFTILLTLISGSTYTRLIPNITSPEQIIWEDIDHVIFVKDENIFEYDILRDDMTKVGERKENEFVGLGDDGNLILCEIEHFAINSKDEFSTVFTIDGKELKFFPTIRPISLKGDTIIAITALDFLEKHYYEIHISDGSMKEISRPGHIESGLGIKKNISGDVWIDLDLQKFGRNIFYELIYSIDWERYNVEE